MDIIFLGGLKIDTVNGIFDWERKNQTNRIHNEFKVLWVKNNLEQKRRYRKWNRCWDYY